MFDLRHEITGELAVMSPLHVGTGGTRDFPRAPGSNEHLTVAAIHRDHEGNPCLPRTTLKGLLRRIAEETLDPVDVEALFGTIKDKGGKGIAGRLLVFGGGRTKAGDAAFLPFGEKRLEDSGYSDAERKLLGDGVFLLARTAIDPAAGVAADHRLFHAEMVAAETTFALRLVLTSAGGDDSKEHALARLAKLVKVLKRLAKDGVPCGRSQADGFGMLKLGGVTVIQREIGGDGILASSNVTPTQWDGAAKADGPALPFEHMEAFRLRCRDLFLVKDTSWDAPAAKRKTERERAAAVAAPRRANDPRQAAPVEIDPPQIRPSRSGEDAPLLPPSSLSGALRARARWLEAKRRHRADPSVKRSAEDVDPASIPDREGEKAAVHTSDRELRSIEELFGINGFRGLLKVRLEKFSGNRLETITSVKLDSFSGAPIDNALFKTEAFLGTTLDFSLGIRPRKHRDEGGDWGTRTVSAEALALYELLVADIRRNGLTLGHGAAKGFGWFEPVEG